MDVHTGIKIFSLRIKRISNKAAHEAATHNNKNNEHIGIRQFLTRQNFPNPNLSKFSTVKILHHTVLIHIYSPSYILTLPVIYSYINNMIVGFNISIYKNIVSLTITTNHSTIT